MTAGRREFGGKNRTAADGENVGVNAGRREFGGKNRTAADGENVGGAEIESAMAAEKIKMAGAVCVIICGL